MSRKKKSRESAMLAKTFREYKVEYEDFLKSKQLRPMGDITLDMEKLLEEMTEDHDLQWGEVLGLVHTWLQIHAPQAQEEYVSSNNSPIFYYGPRK
jgi:hypothetical protein